METSVEVQWQPLDYLFDGWEISFIPKVRLSLEGHTSFDSAPAVASGVTTLRFWNLVAFVDFNICRIVFPQQ